MRLGELLIREGLLETRQLENALVRQTHFAQRLGTSLVELGFVDVDTLARALSAQHHVPAVLTKHVTAIDPKIIALVPAKVAAAHSAIPIGLTQTQPARLVVALRDPHSSAIEELGFVAGMRIDAAVAPEILIRRCLARYYAVGDRGVVALDDMRDMHARPTLLDAAEAEAEPKRLSPPPPPPATSSNDLPRDSGWEEATPPPATVRPVLDLAAASEALRAATSPDQIGDVLTDYMRWTFGCSLVLIVKDGSALGWKGFAPSAEQELVESIAMPLGSPSMLATAYETRAPFRGRPPEEGMALQTRLWKLLHCKPPAEVIVVPILLGKRVINLLYAHGSGEEGLPPSAERDLEALGAVAAVEYARVIRTKK